VPEKDIATARRTRPSPDGGDALSRGQPLLEAISSICAPAAGNLEPSALKVATPPAPLPEQRIKEQDQDGMDAEGAVMRAWSPPRLLRNIAHDEVYKAVIRGYNDWLGEELRTWHPTG